jgi:hypothetical protein
MVKLSRKGVSCHRMKVGRSEERETHFLLSMQEVGVDTQNHGPHLWSPAMMSSCL